jgi:hypothetical protein
MPRGKAAGPDPPETARARTEIRPSALARERRAIGPAVVPGLPVGTRVQLKEGVQHTGTVMPYMPDTSQGMLGLFPVRLDNGFWQICNAHDVTMLKPKDTSE